MKIEKMPARDISKLSAAKMSERLEETDIAVYVRKAPVYVNVSIERYIELTGIIPEGYEPDDPEKLSDSQADEEDSATSSTSSSAAKSSEDPLIALKNALLDTDF